MKCRVKLRFKQCYGAVSGLCISLVAPDSHASVSLIRANCIPCSSADGRYAAVISAWRLSSTFLFEKKNKHSFGSFKGMVKIKHPPSTKHGRKVSRARLRSEAQFGAILRLDQGNKKQILLTYK